MGSPIGKVNLIFPGAGAKEADVDEEQRLDEAVLFEDGSGIFGTGGLAQAGATQRFGSVALIALNAQNKKGSCDT